MATIDTSHIDWTTLPMNPSGGLPQTEVKLTPEQEELIKQMYYRLLTHEFRQSNPELADIVPKSPGGMTGSAPSGPPPPSPPLLPSSQIPANPGMYGMPQTITSQAASAPVYAASSSPGWMSRLWDLVPKDPREIMDIAGTALGANARSSANNRGAQLAAQMDLESLLLDRDQTYFNQRIMREREGREGTSDAWRKLIAGDYAQHRGPQPQLSPYSVKPRDLSGLQPGATAMTSTALDRLMQGNPIAPVTERPLAVDPELMKPGALENISGYVSPWLTLLGRR